jgi:hypothetical protein
MKFGFQNFHITRFNWLLSYKKTAFFLISVTILVFFFIYYFHTLYLKEHGIYNILQLNSSLSRIDTELNVLKYNFTNK